MNRRPGNLLAAAKLFLLAIVITLTPAAALAGYKEGLLALQSGDHQLALAILLPLARTGSPQAQYNVGLLFQQGHGIKKNISKAKTWYLAAAKQGHAGAQNNLGSLYRGY